MIAFNNFNTPNINNEYEENYLAQSEFKANYKNNIININLIKTNNSIIIRSSYYEIKLYPNNFAFIVGHNMPNLDGTFNFLESIFSNNNFYIKNIDQKSIKLSIIRNNAFLNQNELELELTENLKQNYLVLIKDLYSKYSKIENELSDLKNQNDILMNENSELKNKINSLLIQNNNIEMNMIMQNMNLNNNFQNQINMNNFNGNNNNILNQNIIINFNNNNLNNFVQDFSSLIFIEEAEQYTMPLPRNFSVIFREGRMGGYAPILVYTEIGDKVSELIERFEIHAGFNKENNLKYIFNAKPLDREMTAGEAGLTQD